MYLCWDLLTTVSILLVPLNALSLKGLREAALNGLIFHERSKKPQQVLALMSWVLGTEDSKTGATEKLSDLPKVTQQACGSGKKRSQTHR
ncbi:unnamed protein product [Natator depressus]